MDSKHDNPFPQEMDPEKRLELVPTLTAAQMRAMLYFISGYNGLAFDSAYEHVQEIVPISENGR